MEIKGSSMRVSSFLPHLRHIKVTQTIVTDQIITLVAVTARKRAQCPLCHRWAKQVHSRYGRTIRDLPWAGRPVVIRLQVRRFFCRNGCCVRRIFAERVPDLVDVRGRLAHPLRRALSQVGLALGARAGERLAAPLGMPTSPRTLLRTLHALPEPKVPTPRVLGLDDFSLRRGRVFGTILVDLETHRVVDLLPDRSVFVVSQWLREHSGVQIAARDRNGSYAEGIRQGAPDAVQVADRFHLTHNLVEALERLLLHQGPARERATQAVAPLPPPRPLAPWAQRAAAVSHQRQEPKVTTYERVWAMRAQGHDIAHIARTVGVGRPTVYRYLSMERPPARIRRPQRRGRPIDAYVPYLLHRWEEGCRNASQLWREIQTMGYTQSSRTVAHLITDWRHHEHQGQHPTPRPRLTAWTARQVAFLFIAPVDNLTVEQARYLAALHNAQPVLSAAYALAQGFMGLVRERRGRELDAWIAQATASDCAEIRSFATGLLPDKAAVTAGLTDEWSTGPCEGHIHKIKLIKRSMYGKASFPLLRRRVLGAATERPARHTRRAQGDVRLRAA